MAEIKTVDEGGVRCTIWTSELHVFVVGLSFDARSLARMALDLEQRGYNVVAGFDGMYYLEAQKRVGAWAAK